MSRPIRAGSTRTKCAFSLLSMRRHALAGQRAQHDRLGLAGAGARRLERADDAGDVVAVDLGVSQPKARHFSATGSMSRTIGAVGLDAVAVDERDKVVEAEVAAGHRRLPGRSLLHLAVGELDEDARRRAVEPEAERLADALAEAVAERAADDLDARRRVERAHREAAAVGAVGGELRDRQDPGLGQRRPERDRVVAGREQEAVALRPVEIVGVVAQLVEVERGEEVGDAEALADVALALPARHGQHVAAKVGGARIERREIGGRREEVVARNGQSLSRPPERLRRSAVT